VREEFEVTDGWIDFSNSPLALLKEAIFNADPTI